MLEAIIGDTIGSVYEFCNIKDTKFPLFSEHSGPTDDSVMSIAVAEWLAPYVELAERGGYTNMKPVCRSGESCDLAPQIDDFDLDIAFNSCSSELENSPENQQHQDSLELVTDNTDTPF